MKKICLFLMPFLTTAMLYADVIEFFDEGDFSRSCQYGSGNNAFLTDSNIVYSWDPKAGTMKFALKEGRQAGIIMARMHRTATHHAGLDFIVKARMRGQGYIRFQIDEQKSPQRITLTEKWKDCSGTVSNTASERLMLVIWLSGKNAHVELDNLSLTVINQYTVIMPPSPGALLTAPGSVVPAQKFKVYPNDVKGKFIHYTSSDRKRSTLKTDSELYQAIYPSFTAGKEGYHRIIYSSGGKSASRDIVIAPAEEIAAFEKAAKAIDLQDKPMRMLYLGDSLTDFDRGFNHASITAGVLDKYYPGQISMRNAAIGGDQVLRIDDRLKARHVFRGYMYDALWDEKYDIIFISLGQNDTVAFAKDGFSKPQIPVSEVDRRMRSIIKFIKSRSSARIILVSAVLTPENTHPAHHFGVPALVNDYNRCIREVASDCGVEFCDLYTPFAEMNNENRLAYFVGDKVHLSQLGHRFVSLQILKFLSQKN